MTRNRPRTMTRRQPSVTPLFSLRRGSVVGVGILALWLLAGGGATGCTTSEEVVYTGYSAEPSQAAERREPQPDDPLPPIGNVQVISGDTLRLSSGQTLKLHGVRAPRQGEPYYRKARRWLQSLVGHQIVRFSYKEGTRYTDDVWHVNMLVPNPEHQQGGALSANALLLANGLAREEDISSLHFARVGEDGKLAPLDHEKNEAIRELFRKSAQEARNANRNIYSGVREP